MISDQQLRKMQEEINEKNSQPLDDFLGLSPEQMYPIMHLAPQTLEHIFYINADFDEKLLVSVPILKDLLLLFKLLDEAKEVRATRKDNLPVKIVNEIFDKNFSAKWPSGFKRNVQSEEYYSELLAARTSAVECGWIKFDKNKFALGETGRDILKRGFSRKDFVSLLKFYMFSFNWSYPYFWEHCQIIQQAVIFELYVLSKKASSNYLDVKSFGEIFLKAFSFAPEEVDDDYCEESYKPRIVTSMLEQRFIKGFCERFGMVEISKKSSYSDDFGFNDSFKITKLFN